MASLAPEHRVGPQTACATALSTDARVHPSASAGSTLSRATELATVACAPSHMCKVGRQPTRRMMPRPLAPKYRHPEPRGGCHLSETAAHGEALRTPWSATLCAVRGKQGCSALLFAAPCKPHGGVLPRWGRAVHSRFGASREGTRIKPHPEGTMIWVRARRHGGTDRGGGSEDPA